MLSTKWCKNHKRNDSIYRLNPWYYIEVSIISIKSYFENVKILYKSRLWVHQIVQGQWLRLTRVILLSKLYQIKHNLRLILNCGDTEYNIKLYHNYFRSLSITQMYHQNLLYERLSHNNYKIQIATCSTWDYYNSKKYCHKRFLDIINSDELSVGKNKTLKNI